jgi:hypothetical protein
VAETGSWFPLIVRNIQKDLVNLLQNLFLGLIPAFRYTLLAIWKLYDSFTLANIWRERAHNSNKDSPGSLE